MMKRVGFITDSPIVKTGFSTNIRCLLPYLYKTGKYELFQLHQGVDSRSPELNRFPWHSEGAFKPGTFDANQVQKDEKYKKIVSYGNLAVESWIKENKLDVVIGIQDCWAFQEEHYLKSRWFPKIKNNFLIWTTLDSEPILPLAKKQAANCPNYWVWSSFAERSLKQEDSNTFGHVKTVPGCIDVNEWNPISNGEKQALRKNFKIDEDATVFIQLGRNQLRKLFPVTLEAFAKFKKQYPHYNAKLLFHSYLREPSGYPLERLIQQYGLQNDVLTTYYCEKCGDWFIQTYQGEKLNCNNCGQKECVYTAGIQSTITNKQLSKIYGIADASLSVFTSGGLEFHSINSLLCQLPLLCSNYSAGEDFVNQGAVWPLSGNYYYEAGTAFWKHNPNRNEIIRFFKELCDMPENKRKEYGKKGREWALKYFDVNRIGKIFEDWIDSLESHGWNFKYEEGKKKNPHAQIQNDLQDRDYILSLYHNILNRHEDLTESEISHWLQVLKQYPREKVEQYFRQVAAQQQDQEKKNSNNKKLKDYIDDTGRKRLLISLRQSAGDILNFTSILPDIKNSYPNYDIYFACEEKYFNILKGNPYIYKCIPWEPMCESELWAIGQWDREGWFSVYMNPGIFCQTKLNYLSNDNLSINVYKE